MACRAEDLPLIRPMHLGDLPAVMALEVHAYPHPWTAGIFADCLRAGYSAWTLRDADDHLVAYAHESGRGRGPCAEHLRCTPVAGTGPEIGRAHV